MSGKKKTLYISDEAEFVLEQLANANAMSVSGMLCSIIMEKGRDEHIVEVTDREDVSGNKITEYRKTEKMTKYERQLSNTSREVAELARSKRELEKMVYEMRDMLNSFLNHTYGDEIKFSSAVQNPNPIIKESDEKLKETVHNATVNRANRE